MKNKEDLESLKKKWNKILYYSGFDAIRPQQPNKNERDTQKKTKKRGVPRWAKGKH